MTYKVMGTYKSVNFLNNIAYYIYAPKNPVRAIVQISHGMCEYIQRYEEFIKFLNEQDILVCGNDHLGHGKSVLTDNDLGYFSKKDGYKCLIKDLHKLTEIMKKKYPAVPYFMFGHSMGSFALRLYMNRYEDSLDGAIICGTGDKNSLANFGIFIAKSISLVLGEKYRSKFMKKISFKGYNKKFTENDENAWITSDDELRKNYNNDRLCNFTFTASAYVDLCKLIKNATSDKWFEGVRKDLPIILMSGSDDPLGGYSVGVKNVYEKLKEQNVSDLKIILYENARHEIINEKNRQDVYKAVLDWLNDKIKTTKK